LNKGKDSDLLLYEWQDDTFHSTIVQSGRATLLRVRPKEKPYDVKKGVKAEVVAAVIKRYYKLQDAVPKGKSIESAFSLPDTVIQGIPFHNIRCDDRFKDWCKEDLNYYMSDPPNWNRFSCIIGFLSKDGELCFIMCHKFTNALPGILYSERWLRNSLVYKDGKTLVFPKPLPRPKQKP
jgi:hypothetical protein